MVMMGALLELTHTMAKETAFAVLKMKAKNAKLLEVDYRAIDAGIDCIRKQIAERLTVHAREEELTHAS
jgi:Pyruvate/2-oxoacid:ferredoxin oxidoreductase gamma subunit